MTLATAQHAHATDHRTRTAMHALLDEGQSVWLDYLRRGMTRSGELAAMIANGLRGMTSNPTIFEHAIAGSADYDDALREAGVSGKTDREVFEALAIRDVQEAADVFRPVYDETDGEDGFVSIEVSPEVARDTEGSIAQARRLWWAVDRPNVMIKIPGTREGWPAIERCLREGININITLLFSLEHYSAVADAYLRALEARVADGLPIDRVASVASLFVSRVDTEVDKRIEARDGSPSTLLGEVAIANARLVYSAFLEITRSARWRALHAHRAKLQRPLWASTGTKNPAYSDVLYVETLIGSDTITTVPPDTLRLFEHHGIVERTLPGNVGHAQRIMSVLETAGIDFADVNQTLEEEGIAKFTQSFEKVLGVIGEKRSTLADGARASSRRPPREIADFDAAVERRVETLGRAGVVRRIWARDPTVWKEDPNTPELKDRLSWLGLGKGMARQAPALTSFADEIRASFDRVVLCGMGGSSLAAEVLWRTFGRREGYPELVVLDSTDPRAVAALNADGHLEKTLFVISSKSGTTQETISFYRHFWKLAGEGRSASQFVAITDPGTALATLARERRFRRTFLNPPDIGGRYAALSYFGLVPAALIGVDVAELLHDAHRMEEACASYVAPHDNPAARLGGVLGEAALGGRDKLTFVLSPGVSGFGLWAEQLLAESTGKEGKGIIPVVGEPLGVPAVYGTDRLFVAMMLAGEEDADAGSRLDALETAGHPVVRLSLRSRSDLGGEFFRWEFATAVAAAILQVNPFDQPNVTESKRNTEEVLAKRPTLSPPATRDAVDAFLGRIPPDHYLALLAYLRPSPRHDRQLEKIRVALRDRLKVATTVGYGPRYLHSTGQLHKGGPPTGHFLQIYDPAADDLPIPGEPFTFGGLKAAQAEGDRLALERRSRPVIRIEGMDLLDP
jgi:transaldolase/glucose-6-phosphate isomerase